MTDSEIINALEYCCGNINVNDDEECSEQMCYQVVLPEDRNGDARFCRQWLIKDALDLINRQKAEIERLELTLSGVMHSVDKWLDGEELKQDETNRAATMREKTLKIIERHLADVEKYKRGISQAYEDIAGVQANAIKEFAERLKVKNKNSWLMSVPCIEEKIDDLVKEMT